jgi:pantetheine-phosphate adenylyltransferase
MTPKIGVFPGSFDPFTKGHEAIVHKSLDLFDKVIIAIGVNEQKNYLFDLPKRVAHIKVLFEGNERVEVRDYRKLTVQFCKENDARFIIRGLRDSKDFEFEKSIAQMNFDLEGVETVFFLTALKYSAVSSSIIREIYKNDGPIDSFVTMPNLLV